GATARALTFGLARERGGSQPVFDLNYVAVRTCYVLKQGQETFWELRGELPRGVAPPLRVPYGGKVPGFEDVVGARALRPGCYEASISGEGVSATAKFNVGPSGTVTEVTPGEH